MASQPKYKKDTNKPLFSNINRNQIVEKLQNETFDLLIIGGGITGSGIALDAATRGLKVALVEKNDFASGSSSKSTKLIHGGLRYLKQFDFWLVKEIGSERAIIHRLAPHLVVPEKMILPIIENGSYGSWLTSIGLKIYDILASVEGDDKRKMLNQAEALAKEPLLPEHKLQGAGYYAEYRTDDSRLTIEVLKTACRQTALALNYCEVNQLLTVDGQCTGALVNDHILGNKFKIKAKYVVNATGPWVDKLNSKSSENSKNQILQLSKGAHLVFPHEKLPVKQAVYFDVPDGRMIFAIPRGKITYVGTTDTIFNEVPEEVTTNLADANYLIHGINQMFSNIELSLDDVISSWAGLRPLIYEEGKPIGELSRKDEIFESENGLVSIAGGKLTGYRKMAERIVDLIDKKITDEYAYNLKQVQTENVYLTPDPFQSFKEVNQYSRAILKRIKSYGFNQQEVGTLVHRYGRQLELILEKFNTLSDKDTMVRMAKAELWFCIKYEMAGTPMDFFTRRTSRLFFDIQSLEKLKLPILNEFSVTFNWDDKTYKKHLENLNSEIFKANNFE